MRQQMTAGLDLKLQEMAARIRELREIVGLSQEEMARLTDVDLAEYQRCEDGESDLNFAFIYRCAQAFGVDRDGRTNVATQPGGYQTSVDRIFTAGDMHRGQSLVVWAIAEGRAAAAEVDQYLMGYTNLARSV